MKIANNTVNIKEKIKHDEKLDEIEREINEKIDKGLIKAFKYEDYLENERRLGKLNCVCEEEAEYNYNDNAENIKYKHDKLVKSILSDKMEVAKVINKYLKLNIEAGKFEKYTSSYISKDFTARESDIVYKLEDRKIFFLIEHQSKVDRSMPYRLYEYSLAIMKEAINSNEEKRKDYLYPRVIPVVIYTGKKKWNISTSLEDVQEKLEGYEIQVGTYELIDANNYTEDELLNDGIMTSKIMLLEKDLKTEKILEALDKIVKRMKKQEEKEEMNRIIEYIFSEEITKEVREELIRKLEIGGEKKMDAPEVIGREFKIRYENGRKEGIIAGIMQTAKAMLKEKFSIEQISRITGLNASEIEKLSMEE